MQSSNRHLTPLQTLIVSAVIASIVSVIGNVIVQKWVVNPGQIQLQRDIRMQQAPRLLLDVRNWDFFPIVFKGSEGFSTSSIVVMVENEGGSEAKTSTVVIHGTGRLADIRVMAPFEAAKIRSEPGGSERGFAKFTILIESIPVGLSVAIVLSYPEPVKWYHDVYAITFPGEGISGIGIVRVSASCQNCIEAATLRRIMPETIYTDVGDDGKVRLSPTEFK